MEMFNFSAGETCLINRAMSFICQGEVDLNGLADRTLIVKTDNFEDECEQLAPYFAGLGLANSGSRLVFHTAKDGTHKILLNKAGISGLSYIHTLVTELVHLGNLSRYSADHGNVYRFESEQAIVDYFYEFLLWSRFQAMKIATRAHALVSWHEVNGEAPPENGRYQFAQVPFPGDGIRMALQELGQAGTITIWREELWNLLEEMVFYFGRLAFYQREARPGDLDEHFPAAMFEETVGLYNCLSLYAALQAARDYPGWLAEKKNIRTAIVGMQKEGKRRYESEG